MGPNPNEARPNPDIPGLVYIKNTIKNPNIIVGDYTYYFDVTGNDNFEDHVTNFYSFSKDKLIIGKFCDIATGIEFVMGGWHAHRKPAAFIRYFKTGKSCSWKRLYRGKDNLRRNFRTCYL